MTVKEAAQLLMEIKQQTGETLLTNLATFILVYSAEIEEYRKVKML